MRTQWMELMLNIFWMGWIIGMALGVIVTNLLRRDSNKHKPPICDLTHE